MTPANVPTEARFGRVVTPAMDEEAERRVSKSELKVEVYTPLVTVPALPEILIPWVFVQVLVSARRVVEAMMMFVDPLKETPLMVRGVVSVAAEPEMLIPCVFVQVLVSARSVVEAMMMFVDPLKETPLMVREFWSVVAVLALPPMVRVEVETE